MGFKTTKKQREANQTPKVCNVYYIHTLFPFKLESYYRKYVPIALFYIKSFAIKVSNLNIYKVLYQCVWTVVGSRYHKKPNGTCLNYASIFRYIIDFFCRKMFFTYQAFRFKNKQKNITNCFRFRWNLYLKLEKKVLNYSLTLTFF